MSQELNIAGIELGELPDKWRVYGAMAIMKCLDENGNNRLCMKISEDWSMWEATGALQSLASSTMYDFNNSLENPESNTEEPT